MKSVAEVWILINALVLDLSAELDNIIAGKEINIRKIIMLGAKIVVLREVMSGA